MKSSLLLSVQTVLIYGNQDMNWYWYENQNIKQIDGLRIHIYLYQMTYVALVCYWIDCVGYMSLGPMIHGAIHQYHHQCDSQHWFQLADYAMKSLEYSQPSRIDKPPEEKW